MNKTLVGGGDPVSLTRGQTRKCAALLQAYLDGDQNDQDSAHAVAYLLSYVGMETSFNLAGTTPHPWPRVKALPWPHGAVDEPEAGDDEPVPLTRHQALKCSAMVRAALVDWQDYQAPARAVVDLLRAAALVDSNSAQADLTVAQAWAPVHATPWLGSSS
ncbi:MAG: hypothetical protein ABI181_14755 [Mycobacteriaceae bacterium]